jgi:hypothetical protein
VRQAKALIMEDVREMRRRVLRSARKRFHVSDSGLPEEVGDGEADAGEAVVELVRLAVFDGTEMARGERAALLRVERSR